MTTYRGHDIYAVHTPDMGPLPVVLCGNKPSDDSDQFAICLSEQHFTNFFVYVPTSDLRPYSEPLTAAQMTMIDDRMPK